MTKKVIVGIDTSNYTTSCAICDMDGVVIENYKELLPVKSGNNGLRQSDAVFAHVKNFQIISSMIKEKHAEYEIVAIGYSAYPRDAKDSYMPCFLVGKAVAEMIAALYCIPAYQFSHQSGHIMAALYSAKFKPKEKFIAFHVSGGTTEIVLAEPSCDGFCVNILGGSVDLHAGQAIDRIGVKMGLDFPCGKMIEKLALENIDKIPKFNVCVNRFQCNLSGVENLATSLYNKTENKRLVSAFVLSFLEKTIEKLTSNLRKEYGNIKIVYAGGVMSNKIIQEQLSRAFGDVYFAEPSFSTDNACGVALLARERYLK
ncbi:MAG: peptidase M22 [Ruminococcaceae bacterium]|nr:peptidase M22 [Oscillospiraceae bacterium]